MTEERREPSVISHLQGFTCSTSESVAYEAAVEAISEAVGAYSALIAAEEAKEEPDPRILARARAGQAECARSREQLDPADHAAVARAPAPSPTAICGSSPTGTVRANSTKTLVDGLIRNLSAQRRP